MKCGAILTLNALVGIKSDVSPHASPVDAAVLFGDDGLEVGELQEALVEVVQVQDGHQQKGGGDEDPREQVCRLKLLQPKVLESARERDR